MPKILAPGPPYICGLNPWGAANRVNLKLRLRAPRYVKPHYNYSTRDRMTIGETPDIGGKNPDSYRGNRLVQKRHDLKSIEMTEDTK